MSKKDKKNKDIIEKEPVTKGEKVFYSLVVSIGIIAIIVVIVIFAIKGKTDSLMKKFEYLEEGHRVVEIDYDECVDLINSNENIQLILGNSTLNDAKYYVFYANELCEEYNIEQVYFLDTSELSSGEMKYFKQDLQLTSKIFEEMNLINFDEGVIVSQTFTGDIEEYGNCWNQLVAYFTECYGEKE